jgi:hypothetical protein
MPEADCLDQRIVRSRLCPIVENLGDAIKLGIWRNGSNTTMIPGSGGTIATKLGARALLIACFASRSLPGHYTAGCHCCRPRCTMAVGWQGILTPGQLRQRGRDTITLPPRPPDSELPQSPIPRTLISLQASGPCMPILPSHLFQSLVRCIAHMAISHCHHLQRALLVLPAGGIR